MEPSIENQRSAWDALVDAGVAVFIVACILTQVVLAGAVIPPLIILPLLFIGALLWRRRRPRAGTIAILVVGILSFLGNLPFVIDDLSHASDAPLQFGMTLLMVIAVIALVIGAIGRLARLNERAARPILAVAGVLMLVGIGIAALSGSDDSDTAAAGDVTVAAEDIEFDPEQVTVNRGAGVFVKNGDLVRHTFTVEDQDVDVVIPANRDRRVAIDLAPGTYEFTCDVPGHEDMKGKLTVR